GGFALVGDADRGEVLRTQIRAGHGLRHNFACALPDLFRIVLHPSRIGVNLLVLLLADRHHMSRAVKYDESRTGCSLIDCPDVIRHVALPKSSFLISLFSPPSPKNTRAATTNPPPARFRLRACHLVAHVARKPVGRPAANHVSIKLTRDHLELFGSVFLAYLSESLTCPQAKKWARLRSSLHALHTLAGVETWSNATSSPGMVGAAGVEPATS